MVAHAYCPWDNLGTICICEEQPSLTKLFPTLPGQNNIIHVIIVIDYEHLVRDTLPTSLNSQSEIEDVIDLAIILIQLWIWSIPSYKDIYVETLFGEQI